MRKESSQITYSSLMFYCYIAQSSFLLVINSIQSKIKRLTTIGTLEQGLAHHNPGNNNSDDFHHALQVHITFNLAD